MVLLKDQLCNAQVHIHSVGEGGDGISAVSHLDGFAVIEPTGTLDLVIVDFHLFDMTAEAFVLNEHLRGADADGVVRAVRALQHGGIFGLNVGRSCFVDKGSIVFYPLPYFRKVSLIEGAHRAIAHRADIEKEITAAGARAHKLL